ncbi:hypothetical protein [Gallibacterium genomosp. 1]|nr:hypothetical protein [Gallibacterium genomosp. 1]
MASNVIGTASLLCKALIQKPKSYRRLLSTVEIERQYGGILHRTLKIRGR